MGWRGSFEGSTGPPNAGTSTIKLLTYDWQYYRSIHMQAQYVFPPELKNAGPEQKLEYLRTQRAGVERVIEILETLAAVRSKSGRVRESAA